MVKKKKIMKLLEFLILIEFSFSTLRIVKSNASEVKAYGNFHAYDGGRKSFFKFIHSF